MRRVLFLILALSFSLQLGCGGTPPPQKSTNEEAAKKELNILNEMRQKEMKETGQPRPK